MKRLLDVAIALPGLVLAAPLLLILMLLIWCSDWHSPFYLSTRIGRHGIPFRMLKLRTMIVNADRTGIDSTSARDPRVTRVGRAIRRYKLDELPQLWNVLTGDMSLVGPRPQVEREARIYTVLERRLFDVLPGVTDFASIVFADLAEILDGRSDVDIAYNQLVRPGKSRLGLFYVQHQSIGVDIRLLALTAAAMVSRDRALAGVEATLRKLGAEADLLKLARRRSPLLPAPPPGSQQVVTSRANQN